MKFLSTVPLALVILFGGAPAHAQQSADTYPNRPIKVVAPFAAGASTDILARFIAQGMQVDWGQPAVVENRSGASGAVGTAVTASAPADGYTLIVVTSGHVINPNFAKLAFDPMKDFEPIIFLTSIPSMLVVHPSLPVKTVPEFVKLIKDNPGKYVYATSGAGGSSHITTEVWKHVAGLSMDHAAYKGGAPAIADLVGGHVKIAMSTVPTASVYVNAGQVRAIAVTSPQRSPAFPNVPTLAESGYPAVALTEWFALMAPTGVPRPIREKINEEVKRIMNQPDVKERLAAQGMVFSGGSIDESDTFIKAEFVKWGRLINDANVKSQ